MREDKPKGESDDHNVQVIWNRKFLSQHRNSFWIQEANATGLTLIFKRLMIEAIDDFLLSSSRLIGEIIKMSMIRKSVLVLLLAVT